MNFFKRRAKVCLHTRSIVTYKNATSRIGHPSHASFSPMYITKKSKSTITLKGIQIV